MAGFFIFTSNRMEVLAERLAEVLREQPLAAPMAAEVVIVQSRGMERWVSMEMARLNGVSANVRFPFPNAFLEDAFRAVSAGAAVPSAFEPDAVTFRIMGLLAEQCDRPGFEVLQHFLAEEPRDIKRYQLARKIADLFDQYLVFRPEMIARWEAGEVEEAAHHRWQALLWRELVRRTPGPHRVEQRRRLLEAVRSGALNVEALPRRVTLFGVSYLPRFHLETVAALSRVLDVHVFCLNPCREYWADIVSERTVQKWQRRTGDFETVEGRLHLEHGNRLLASLGALGRDFLDLLAESSGYQREEFVEPGGTTLLARLQSDILMLTDGRPDALLSADDSIRMHACHSPMREVEVLQDQLLAMFAEEPRLRPRDVVVMTPDIEGYAPFISAVFGAQNSGRPRIPFTVADRVPHREGGGLRAFFQLLDLADSRFGVGDVLRLLEAPAVLNRFRLEEIQLPRLEQWIRAACICWGQDEAALRALGLPARPHNTWRAGTERLLLGYALPAQGTDVFHGIRGIDAIEAGETRVMGPFLDFMEQVFEYGGRLRKRQRLGSWRDDLADMLSAFFTEDDGGPPELPQLRRILDEMAGLEFLAGFRAEVPIGVVRQFLSERLDGAGAGRGFMAGGVTFCSLLPMRTIPFEVVCLLGMNHDAYPRESRQLAFDLIAQAPRPGDRSRRNDDKYLFLEALLSARRRFYISYVGQSIQDNSPAPPSVVVSELVDALRTGYGLPIDEAGRPLVTFHPLQAFSAGYFQGGSELFSYSADDMRAAAAAAAPPRRRPFAAEAAALTAEETALWSRVDLADLISFFGNPAKFFVRRRLGASLDPPAPSASDSEPFALTGLDRFALGSRLLEQRLGGQTPQDAFEALSAEGRLPHGVAGAVEFSRLWAEVDWFAGRLAALPPAVSLKGLDVRWEIAGFSLTAAIAGEGQSNGRRYRFGQLRAKDQIELWLQHLVICLGASGEGKCESVFVGTDRTLRLAPVGESLAVLEGLLGIYRQGLERPLPFFPKSSLEYARTLRASGSERRASGAARSVWEGGDGRDGEGSDPYYRRCFEAGDALGAEFRQLSRRVFDPILDCARSEKAA